MSEAYRKWAAERGTDEDRPTPPVAPDPAPAEPLPPSRPPASPGPLDTVTHADGCGRPVVVRTLVARNATSSRWVTKCSSCGRRTFEVVDAELVRQRAAGLVPGQSWPQEPKARALPYVKRYFERPEEPPPATGHRVVGW